MRHCSTIRASFQVQCVPLCGGGEECELVCLCLSLEYIVHTEMTSLTIPCLPLFKGYRTLDDLRKSGKLTRIQQIGMKHYDDFVERMPRSEAAEIENKVSR